MKEHQNLFRDLQEDFRKMKKNLLVAQSGGPTAAINATLAGVIKQAILRTGQIPDEPKKLQT